MTGDRFEEFTKELGGSPTRRGVLTGIGVAVVGGVAATVLKPFRAEASCPAGTLTCGTACCPAGAACNSAQRSCCCGKSQAVCGQACCVRGVACADRANSICGCPSGRVPCTATGKLTCCAAGTACSSTNGTCQPVASFNTTASTCCSLQGESCTNTECCSGLTCVSGHCLTL